MKSAPRRWTFCKSAAGNMLSFARRKRPNPRRQPRQFFRHEQPRRTGPQTAYGKGCIRRSRPKTRRTAAASSGRDGECGDKVARSSSPEGSARARSASRIRQIRDLPFRTLNRCVPARPCPRLAGAGYAVESGYAERVNPPCLKNLRCAATGGESRGPLRKRIPRSVSSIRGGAARRSPGRQRYRRPPQTSSCRPGTHSLHKRT